MSVSREAALKFLVEEYNLRKLIKVEIGDQ
jgi:hypothetical protein